MLISILALSLGFHTITFERSTFTKIAIFKIKPVCPLVSAALLHVVAENVVIDRRTDRRTDLQTKYCNPRCACAPRVNYVPLPCTLIVPLYMQSIQVGTTIYGS